MANPIFREESLSRLQSPEELDQLLVVVNRKAWLILATLAFICFAGVAWSIMGRIPVRVDGIGVLVDPGNVKGIQSPANRIWQLARFAWPVSKYNKKNSR